MQDILASVAAVAAVGATVVAVLSYLRGRRTAREIRDEHERVAGFHEARRRLRDGYAEVADAALLAQEPNRIAPDLRLLGDPAWLLPRPVDLAQIRIEAVAADRAGSFQPFIDHWSGIWPTSPTGAPVRRYSEAIDAFDRPRIWNVELPAFRLYDVATMPLDRAPSGDSGSTLRLRYAIGDGRYRDAMDTQEALGFLWGSGRLHEQPEELPDPFDLAWRCASTAICTLTIVRAAESDPWFYMHKRDPKSVAVSGNQFHVTPCGEFETADINPASVRDFDLWASIQREYAEEFLGYDEFDGTRGSQPDYDKEPFATLSRLRERGELRIWCLGAAINPLTHKFELLTVAVFSQQAFEGLTQLACAGYDVDAGRDDEGTKTRSPFTLAGIDSYRNASFIQLNPFADALLRLAWQHRAALV